VADLLNKCGETISPAALPIRERQVPKLASVIITTTGVLYKISSALHGGCQAKLLEFFTVV